MTIAQHPIRILVLNPDSKAAEEMAEKFWGHCRDKVTVHVATNQREAVEVMAMYNDLDTLLVHHDRRNGRAALEVVLSDLVTPFPMFRGRIIMFFENSGTGTEDQVAEAANHGSWCFFDIPMDEQAMCSLVQTVTKMGHRPDQQQKPAAPAAVDNRLARFVGEKGARLAPNT